MSNEYSIPQIIEGNGQVPIFDIMNVKGYCITYGGRRLTFVFAADIAREGGLVFEDNQSYVPTSGRKNNTNFLPQVAENNNEQIRVTSGTNLIQGDAAQSVGATSGTHLFRDVCENTRESFASTSGRKNVYEYETIRWNRFNKYLNDTIKIAKQENPEILQWLQLPIHSYSYIPLEFAIMILMHCRSQQALKFQWILTSMIVPQLQSYYDQYQQQQLQYYQDMLDTDQLYSTTEIAREFEMSAQQLRRILQEHQIIYPCNKTWQISQALVHYDYVRNKSNASGNDHPYWTQYGRRFVIDLLCKYGYKPHQHNDVK